MQPIPKSTLNRFTKRRSALLTCGAIFVAVYLGACTTSGLAPGGPQNAEVFSLPYDYEGSLGAGSGSVSGLVILPKGSESSVASRAIVFALQELEYSIRTPSLKAGESLPQKTQWDTDWVPLSQAMLKKHNEQSPNMRLPENYRYSLRYSGDYVADRRQLDFSVSAHLRFEPAAAPPRDYDKAYSAKFFVEALGKLIEDKVRLITKK